MPIVTNTDTLAAANSTNSISFSRQMRLRRWARRALVSPWAITGVEAGPLGATADIGLCLPPRGRTAVGPAPPAPPPRSVLPPPPQGRGARAPSRGGGGAAPPRAARLR